MALRAFLLRLGMRGLYLVVHQRPFGGEERLR